MKQRKKCGKYNKSRSLLRYDCAKAKKDEPHLIYEDLTNRGYDVNKIEIVDREVFDLGKVALVEIKICSIRSPEYVTEMQPLWNFK